MKEQIEAQIVDLQRELSRVEHELEGIDSRVKEAVQWMKDEEHRQRATAAKCDRLRAIIKLLESYKTPRDIEIGTDTGSSTHF